MQILWANFDELPQTLSLPQQNKKADQGSAMPNYPEWDPNGTTPLLIRHICRIISTFRLTLKAVIC